jgi:hypothetical protein
MERKDYGLSEGPEQLAGFITQLGRLTRRDISTANDAD